MRTLVSSLLASATWAGVCLVASGARAQGADRAAAEALFEKGRQAMASAEYDTACAAFEESNRLDPAPGTQVNLASCEEKRNHLAAAWQWLAEAAEKLPAGDPRRELVVQRAADMKARLPELTIRLAPDAPSDSRVTKDAVELHGVSLGLALPTDPGPHHVVVVAAGHAPGQFDFTLAEKEKKELVVGPGALATASPETQPAPIPTATGTATGAASTPSASAPATGDRASSSSGFDKRTVGYVVGGVGVAGIGTALVLGGLVLGKKSTVSDHCDSNRHTCDQEGLDAASSGKTLSTASTALFIVGAAATGVGAYFILTSKRETVAGVAAIPGGAWLHVSKEF